MHTCQAAHRACILKMAPCSSHVLHSASCKWSISRPSTSHTRKPFSPHPVSLLHPFNLHGRERRCHNLTETFRFPNWCSLYKLTFLLQKDKFSCEGRDALAPSNTGLKKRLYWVLNRTRLTEAVFVFLQCQAFPSTHWQNKPPFWASHKKLNLSCYTSKHIFLGMSLLSSFSLIHYICIAFHAPLQANTLFTTSKSAFWKFYYQGVKSSLICLFPL